jgi:hypothetical protein
MKYFATLTIAAASLFAPCIIVLAATEAKTIGEHVCYGIAFIVTALFFFRMQKIVLAMK